MKNFRLTILFVVIAIFSSNAQTSFKKLNAAIKSVPIVVEGKIIRQSSFRDENSGNIFTKNYLWPKILFKGLANRDTVVFLTRGGRVDDIISTVSHTVQVSVKQEGIFLLQQSRAVLNQYEISSYIERLTYDREFEAYFEGGHEKYPSWRFMREEVGRVCGKDMTIKRISSQELLLLDIPEFCVKLANPILDAINKKVTFDVKAKSNIAGLEFARADIPLKYPQELLGNNVVMNGKVEAFKGESTNTSFYDLNIHDIVDDKFMLTLSSSCNGGESGFVLGTEFEKIAKVTVEVQEYGDLGTINAESFDVDGFAKYFLDGACQEFVEKCVEGQIALLPCTVSNIELAPFSCGIGQKITISGTDFGGGTIGQVSIPDADDDGIHSITINGSDPVFFQKWTNDTIIMNLGSFTNSSLKPGKPFGSGSWVIKPDTTSATSIPCAINVLIDYSLFSVYDYNEFRTFGLAQKKSINADTTHNWYIIDGIDSDSLLKAKGITDSLVVATAKQVYCDWEIATGIDFEYKGKISTRVPGDDKYTIFFGSLKNISDTTDLGPLMRTSTNFSTNTCVASDKYFSGRILDGDTEVNTEYDWYFGDSINIYNSVNNNKYDFYSVLLHEVGHSLGLNHAMDLNPLNGANDPKIMYYGFDTQQIKRKIDNTDSQGVIWLKDTTAWSINTQYQCFPSGSYFIDVNPHGGCAYPVSTKVILDNNSCNLKFQNFVNKGESIHLTSDAKTINNIVLFDIYGRVVYHSTGRNNNIRISTERLPAGSYFLRAECNDGARIYKVYIL